MIRITLIIITLITTVLLAASRDATTRATAGLSVRSITASPAPKQVEIFGQKINYIEAGSGPNVILRDARRVKIAVGVERCVEECVREDLEKT